MQPKDTMPLTFTTKTETAKLPVRGTPHSAGHDLFADAEVTVVGGAGNVLVSTGVSATMNRSCYGRIAMRSGLAVREHLSVSAGVIDRDYTGVIGVVVYCTKIGHSYTIKQGERFAQFIPEMIVELTPIDNKPMAEHVGYGSTGSN